MENRCIIEYNCSEILFYSKGELIKEFCELCNVKLYKDFIIIESETSFQALILRTDDYDCINFVRIK